MLISMDSSARAANGRAMHRADSMPLPVLAAENGPDAAIRGLILPGRLLTVPTLTPDMASIQTR